MSARRLSKSSWPVRKGSWGGMLLRFSPTPIRSWVCISELVTVSWGAAGAVAVEAWYASSKSRRLWW